MQHDTILIDKETTTGMVLEIIEDGSRPRTIREIQEKYELKFPFRVKKVLLFDNLDVLPIGAIIEVTSFRKFSDLEEIAALPPYSEIDNEKYYAPVDRGQLWVLA